MRDQVLTFMPSYFAEDEVECTDDKIECTDDESDENESIQDDMAVVLMPEDASDNSDTSPLIL